MLTYADVAGSNGSARLGAENVSGTLKTSNNEWVLTVAYENGFRPPWIGWAVVLAGTHFTCFTLLVQRYKY